MPINGLFFGFARPQGYENKERPSEHNQNKTKTGLKWLSAS